MNDIVNFIKEGLKISSKSKVNSLLSKEQYHDIVEFMVTASILYRKQNSFFHDNNLKEIVDNNKIDIDDFDKYLRKGLAYNFKQRGDKEFIEIIENYPKTSYKDEIDNAIIDGIKKYFKR